MVVEMVTGKKKELLYVTAFDKDGVLVKAKDAEKTQDYFCPECKDKLILKKSGKTGKGSKRPHFAHYSQSPNCTPEGVLHKSFKLLLLDKIKNNITAKSPINIEWECAYCHEKHNGNLVQCAFDIKDEFQMEKCRADIALLNQEGKPFCVLEIIVTHKPEEAALAYYKENKIILIQIELESEDDLDKLDAKINIPTSIDYCFNPKCPNIDNNVYNKQPIIKRVFFNINQFMDICDTMIIHHFFGSVQSSVLTDKDKKFLKANNIHFKKQNTGVGNNRYRGRSPRF